MHYSIEVNSELDPSWEAWFAPLQIGHTGAGTTTLSGDLPDQAALYGVLLKLDRLGLTLLTLETRTNGARTRGDTGRV